MPVDRSTTPLDAHSLLLYSAGHVQSLRGASRPVLRPVSARPRPDPRHRPPVRRALLAGAGRSDDRRAGAPVQRLAAPPLRRPRPPGRALPPGERVRAELGRGRAARAAAPASFRPRSPRRPSSAPWWPSSCSRAPRSCRVSGAIPWWPPPAPGSWPTGGCWPRGSPAFSPAWAWGPRCAPRECGLLESPERRFPWPRVVAVSLGFGLLFFVHLAGAVLAAGIWLLLCAARPRAGHSWWREVAVAASPLLLLAALVAVHWARAEGQPAPRFARGPAPGGSASSISGREPTGRPTPRSTGRSARRSPCSRWR